MILVRLTESGETNSPRPVGLFWLIAPSTEESFPTDLLNNIPLTLARNLYLLAAISQIIAKIDEVQANKDLKRN